MLFKNSSDTSEYKSWYWISSSCVGLGDGNCRYVVRNQDIGGVHCTFLCNSADSKIGTEERFMCPVVSLTSKIQTTGQDANGVWQLKID